MRLLLAGGLTPTTSARRSGSCGRGASTCRAASKRPPGRKDPRKLRQFIEAARAATVDGRRPHPIDLTRRRRSIVVGRIAGADEPAVRLANRRLSRGVCRRNHGQASGRRNIRPDVGSATRHGRAARAARPRTRRARTLRRVRRTLRARDARARARAARSASSAPPGHDDAFRAEYAALLASYVGRPDAGHRVPPALGAARRAGAAEARRPHAHRLAQDQQRARPGAADPAHGQGAGDRGDGRRPARRRDRDRAPRCSASAARSTWARSTSSARR